MRAMFKFMPESDQEYNMTLLNNAVAASDNESLPSVSTGKFYKRNQAPPREMTDSKFKMSRMKLVDK